MLESIIIILNTSLSWQQSWPNWSELVDYDQGQEMVAEAQNEPLSLPENVSLKVPFTSQAPGGDWRVPFDEACEEASLIMVNNFYAKKEFSTTEAKAAIIKMVEWQNSRNMLVDIDMSELKRVSEEYLGRPATVYYDEQVSAIRIREELAAGRPVILPVAGQRLNNPNFRGAGPPYHVIVVTGYDQNGFITNDPGTRKGESYYYAENILIPAIHDWTGSKSTIEEGRKAMLVLNN